MQLEAGNHGCEIHVAVCRTRAGTFNGLTDNGQMLCFLPHRLNRDLEVIQMERIASFVARAALRQGALLIHGALAEYCGSGFIMAGPGTVGKSTASRRLPSAWRSLSDDMTLVVRDDQGQHWAHPWPTWSRYENSGSGGSWAVEQAIPLRAVFFLSQSPSDHLESVNVTQATALTLESAVNLARSAASPLPTLRSPLPIGIRAAKALASAVPAYSLKLSLTGRFWEEIERVLPVGAPEPRRPRTPEPRNPRTPELPRVADGSLRLVYTGTDMSPTLQEPELLDVRPYGNKRVRPGDVICYESPDTGRTVVQRVVSVGGRGTGAGGPEDGIRTRGDNSRADDPRILTAADIIGRVEAAGRGARRRAIPGGRRGLVALRSVRLGQGIRRSAGLIPHTLYGFVAGFGPLSCLLPLSRRPRLVRFDARCGVFLKLLNGRQTVGQYDARLQTWYVRRPFRLFVDEQTLPSPKSLVPSP